MTGLQLSVTVANYTKVPLSWNEDHYTPDFNKLYLIEDGEGYIQVDGHRYYPTPGTLCLLPAEKLQSYGTVSPHTYSKYWCHFTAKLGGQHLFQLLDTPAVVQLKDFDKAKSLFQQLVEARWSEAWTAELHVQAALLGLIAAYIEESGAVVLNTQHSGPFRQMNVVLAYIDAHLSENITVEELAQLVHFHPNYFIRIFKKTTGLSPIQYVNRKRMDKAIELLQFSKLSVSAVSHELGMEPAYFSRLFKEYTGLSPSEYRERT
nr:AraC family transcriptional regulator [Paenibacillus phyllosphaerae]